MYRNMIPLRFHTFLQDEADLRLEEDLARLREEPVTGRQFQELHLAHFDPNTRQPLLYFDHLDPGPGGLGVADKGGRPLSMIVKRRLQTTKLSTLSIAFSHGRFMASL